MRIAMQLQQALFFLALPTDVRSRKFRNDRFQLPVSENNGKTRKCTRTRLMHLVAVYLERVRFIVRVPD